MQDNKAITLEQLKELERAEYNTLEELQRMQFEYEREGNERMANITKDSVQWTRGRWGMIVDIIENL